MRCPGQDLRFWKLEDIFDIACPHCGTAVEFWKDEPGVKCPECRTLVVNPKLDLGCAQWCRHAEQCLGALANPEDILSKKLIKEMKGAIGDDRQKIDHAMAVFGCARQILASEPGDARVVNAAAILHGLDVPCPDCEATAMHEPTDAADLRLTRDVLLKCGVDAGLVDRICELIAAHCRGVVDDRVESRILWDAEWLSKLGNCAAKTNVSHRCKTEKGRELAADPHGNSVESSAQSA
jgi:HD superfamily phosphodiesterase